MIGTEMDDIPFLLDAMYANATMASGDNVYQNEAYKQFCKELSDLESLLKEKGILGE